MDLQQRVVLLKKLGDFLLSDDEKWLAVKEQASHDNPWFIPEFVDYQLQHIAQAYLSGQELTQWINAYQIPDKQESPKNVGIIMAGNIPLAGFHDFLSVFISGHHQSIKPSTKDAVLINGIVAKLIEWEPECANVLSFAEQLRHRDAYIATGSNNSGRYFDYYFGKYPHMIRRNRTSVAILTGNESTAELEKLADDVFIYFGLGCRNVTKIYVPEGYDFLGLLEAFNKYTALADNHRYKNNYDYQLAILIINKLYYMTNGSVLLQESKGLFSPISQLNYEFYNNAGGVLHQLDKHTDIQCVVGNAAVPFGKPAVHFGKAQKPGLSDYADKADTLTFLSGL